MHKKLATASLGIAVLITAGALLGAVHDSGLKTVEDIVGELYEYYGPSEISTERYLPPFVSVDYEISAGMGEKVLFTFQAHEGTNMLARYAWDFESDGLIDWTSSMQSVASHSYHEPGLHYATVYAFDVAGRWRSAEVRVEIDNSNKPCEYGRRTSHIDWSVMKERKGDRNKALTDPVVTWWLLAAYPDDFYWAAVVNKYHELRDTFGIPDENIIVVSGCSDDLGCVGNHLDDTTIIDYRYTSAGKDSAFTFLLDTMTANDVLHVIHEGHGAGRTDSTCLEYRRDYLDSLLVPWVIMGGRIEIDDPADADQVEIESDFISTWNHNTGELSNEVGMNTWTGQCFAGHRIAKRWKWVATFSGEQFFNTAKTSDTDVYIELIMRFHAGDLDRDGVVDSGQPWDYDGDGRPPLTARSPSLYTFDEDDWDTLYKLQVDWEHNGPADSLYGLHIKIDSGFDGNPELCNRRQFLHWDSLTIRAHDTDNNGWWDGVDWNEDGDLDDSVGHDTWSGIGPYDDDLSDFLDSLEYATVTFSLSDCFGGGQFNDLSRSNVLIATSATSGTYAWGESPLACLTEGSSCNPDSDLVITFVEAFNAGTDGRHRFDDNGDGIGHARTLPNGGDGTSDGLGDTMSYGSLPPPAPLPIPQYPEGDTVDACFPTFYWSDTGTCDSFEFDYMRSAYNYPMITGITDTSYTLPLPVPLDTLWTWYWKVRSWDGLARSEWSEWVAFYIRNDDADTCCCAPCCQGIRGNVDGDTLEQINIVDFIYLNDYLNNDGPPPPCMQEANIDAIPCGGGPDSLDLDYLSEYMFNSGPPPPSCP